MDNIITRITLENPHGVYTVALKSDPCNIHTFIEELVIPLLLAAGYSRSSIDTALGLDG